MRGKRFFKIYRDCEQMFCNIASENQNEKYMFLRIFKKFLKTIFLFEKRGVFLYKGHNPIANC